MTIKFWYFRSMCTKYCGFYDTYIQLCKSLEMVHGGLYCKKNNYACYEKDSLVAALYFKNIIYLFPIINLSRTRYAPPGTPAA